ncbi:MAG: PQQ-binding-like beta-propeller repeat protein [Haloarculaceae archaeon]
MVTRRQALRLAGATVVGGVAGCLGNSFDPLAETDLDERAATQFRGGLKNHGYQDRAVPEAVEVDWSLPVNRGEHTAAKSSPVRTPGGDIVVAGDTGTVHALRPDGTIRWTANVEPTTRGIHGTPAIANGSVYVGAYDGALYAFDLATGEREWRTQLGDAIGSSPKYYNGVLYIAVEYSTPSGSVAAVDAATGNVFVDDGWPTNHPHSTLGIALDAGRLVVGANDGVLRAWSFPELDREWTFETDGEIKGPVAIADGAAIFGSWDEHVYAVELADGTERWAVETGDLVMSAPAVADGTVYVGSHDHHLYALDVVSGEKLWAYETGGQIIGGVVATPDHVLAGSYDTDLHAVGRADGERAWRAAGRGVATSAPLVTDEAVYYAERAPEPGERPGFCYRLTGE